MNHDDRIATILVRLVNNDKNEHRKFANLVKVPPKKRKIARSSIIFHTSLEISISMNKPTIMKF